MKKNIVVNVIFIFSFLVCACQTKKIELGIQGGINLGSVYGSGTDFTYLNQNKKDFFGGIVGLQFKYRLSKNYALKTSIQFEQNAIVLYDITLVDHSFYPYGQGDEIYKQSYINMPIVIERSFGNKIKFNVNGGLFTGILIKDILITKVKQRFIPVGQPPRLEVFKTKKDNHKSINYGLSFGTGVLFPVSQKIKMLISVQNNLGLLNIANEVRSVDYALYTNSTSFLTGLVFSL